MALKSVQWWETYWGWDKKNGDDHYSIWAYSQPLGKYIKGRLFKWLNKAINKVVPHKVLDRVIVTRKPFPLCACAWLDLREYALRMKGTKLCGKMEVARDKVEEFWPHV